MPLKQLNPKYDANTNNGHYESRSQYQSAPIFKLNLQRRFITKNVFKTMHGNLSKFVQ
jgi:hypothetical protein